MIVLFFFLIIRGHKIKTNPRKKTVVGLVYSYCTPSHNVYLLSFLAEPASVPTKCISQQQTVPIRYNSLCRSSFRNYSRGGGGGTKPCIYGHKPTGPKGVWEHAPPPPGNFCFRLSEMASVVSFPDPDPHAGKGSGTLRAISWFC